MTGNTKVTRSLRIVALPLTSRPPPKHVDPLVYYAFRTPPPPRDDANPGIAKKVTNKVSSLWAGFGKAPEGSWKFKTFRYGEQLMDKIEFEELALKGLDPSLGPRLSNLKKLKDTPENEKDHTKISLLYPPSLFKNPLLQLQSMVGRRVPRHRKGFWFWLLISPLTAPIAIIPIVPNLPFFFCVWRSWHHYKAYKASAYLESLLERGTIVPEPSKQLDDIYSTHRPRDPLSPSSSDTLDSSSIHHADSSAAENKSGQEDKDESTVGRLLITRDAVPPIVDAFNLPPSASADMYRALAQASFRLQRETRS
ncbi:hypothetical protein JAAARDRAFT_467692 [Jaapia argillacea MUCL 33604]|uniref:Mitochondrial K+-H+ exchange-related-domain-containing protein n=1 Tax=Jaapia argillacea MUCL 33604 TaxID=933084 RepID=A0A067QJ69_9AGAM|nr:hypothetical protein JAAARDRAFT_467692 [Jaapia argillacea MUCL 33604]